MKKTKQEQQKSFKLGVTILIIAIMFLSTIAAAFATSPETNIAYSEFDDAELYKEVIQETPQEYLEYVKYIRIQKYAKYEGLRGYAQFNTKTIHLYDEHMNSEHYNGPATNKKEIIRHTLYHEIAHLMAQEWGHNKKGETIQAKNHNEETANVIGNMLYNYEAKQ